MLHLKEALEEEKKETTAMFIIYQKYTQGFATKEEIKIANRQFVQLLKGLGLGVFAILPFAPITIPIVVKLGRLVGVEVIPTTFTKKRTKKKIIE
jgi:hypothetical protein